MKEYPILFHGEMVRAILAGRKTMTRRLVKPKPINDKVGMCNAAYCGEPRKWFVSGSVSEYTCNGLTPPVWKSPFGGPGDRLWVRETWRPTGIFYDKPNMETRDCGRFSYRADAEQVLRDEHIPWRPNIFMPRWASRLTLEVVNVRVERLQDITEEDAMKEGYPGTHVDGRHIPWSAYGWFMATWQTIYTKPGERYEDNPWVWVGEFKAI